MSKINPHASSTIDERYQDKMETPDSIVRDIEMRLNIDFLVDAAATKQNAKAPYFLTRHDNAVSGKPWRTLLNRKYNVAIPWQKIITVFINPPYTRPESKCAPHCEKATCKKRGWHNLVNKPGLPHFVRAAWKNAKDDNMIVVGLLPDDRSTSWYHNYIRNEASYILEPKNRINFIDPSTGKVLVGNARPSMIVVWTPWGSTLRSTQVLPLDEA